MTSKKYAPMLIASQWCELFGVRWDDSHNLYFVPTDTKEMAIAMAEAGFNNPFHMNEALSTLTESAG